MLYIIENVFINVKLNHMMIISPSLNYDNNTIELFYSANLKVIRNIFRSFINNYIYI